jgi:hypothetical protein
MRKMIKRLSLLLATGAASLFLAACYGVPMMYGADLPSRIWIRVTDSGGKPIPHIGVSADWLGSMYYTDDMGYASLPTSGLGAGTTYCRIQLDDIDGAENGSFARGDEMLKVDDQLTTIQLAANR